MARNRVLGILVMAAVALATGFLVAGQVKAKLLTAETNRLRTIGGLVPVHGPGVAMVIAASGLRALDLQDAVNNLAAAEAAGIAANNRRVAAGGPIRQTSGGGEIRAV